MSPNHANNILTITNNVKLPRSPVAAVAAAATSSSPHPHSRSATRHQPRGPRLPVFGMNKAYPTVSITSTNVASAITHGSLDLISSKQELAIAPQNFIPFPSAPVQGSTPCADDQDGPLVSPEGGVSEVSIMTTITAGAATAPIPCTYRTERTITHPSPWPHEPIRRRRSKTCLIIHRDLQSNRIYTQDGHDAEQPGRRAIKTVHVYRKCIERPSLPLPPVPTPNEGSAPRAGVRRPSMSAGTPLFPVAKRFAASRKSKRQAADVQFLAAMHRSISWRLKMKMGLISPGSMADTEIPNAGGGGGGCECGCGLGAMMYDQDMKLVERLWHVLVDQGCRPVLVNDEQLTAAVPAAAQVQERESEGQNEHASGVEASAPSSGLTEAPLPTTPSSPSLPLPAVSGMTLVPQSALPPCQPSQSPMAAPLPALETMTLPQLVASLTLRHRDRSTTRLRSKDDRSQRKIQRRVRSPLIKVFSSPAPAPTSKLGLESDALALGVVDESADPSSG